MYLSTLTSILALLATTATACIKIPNVQHTFYGYPDNSPRGPKTAYPCGGRNFTAGGTGTYSDPLTFASASGEFTKCEIIFAPCLKKYLRMEDICGQCTTDWNNGGAYHIDIWTGSNTVDGGQEQVDCEKALTPKDKCTVIRSPDNNLPTDLTPLYTKGGNPPCQTAHVYTNPTISDYCP